MPAIACYSGGVLQSQPSRHGASGASDQWLGPEHLGRHDAQLLAFNSGLDAEYEVLQGTSSFRVSSRRWDLECSVRGIGAQTKRQYFGSALVQQLILRCIKK